MQVQTPLKISSEEEEKENALNYEVEANLDDFGVYKKQIGKKNVTLNLVEVTV